LLIIQYVTYDSEAVLHPITNGVMPVFQYV
jgi:hypothetical protein